LPEPHVGALLAEEGLPVAWQFMPSVETAAGPFQRLGYNALQGFGLGRHPRHQALTGPSLPPPPRRGFDTPENPRPDPASQLLNGIHSIYRFFPNPSPS